MGTSYIQRIQGVVEMELDNSVLNMYLILGLYAILIIIVCMGLYFYSNRTEYIQEAIKMIKPMVK